jgi:hypothetical protein
MSLKDVAKRSAQLGMLYNTVRHRLYRLLLFDLMRRCGVDLCARCGLPITDVKDFTIEHVKPWLDVDTALFWDLDNIGFSHHACNSAAARVTEASRGIEYKRRVGPEGTAWCTSHQDFLDIGNFSANKYNWNGLQAQCRECRKLAPSRQSRRVVKV